MVDLGHVALDSARASRVAFPVLPLDSAGWIPKYHIILAVLREDEPCPCSERGDELAAKVNRAKSKSENKLESKKQRPANKKLKIALAGFGTVGRSVAKLLCQEANGSFELTHIFNRKVARKKVDWVPPSVRWTESIHEVLSSDTDIFVELVGGIKPAGEWIRKRCGPANRW